MLVTRSALLCDRLKQEVADRDSQLKQGRETILELSVVKAEVEGRLQGEGDKYALLATQRLEMEAKLVLLTSELEVEKTRCLQLQNEDNQDEKNLKQQTNE